MGRFRLNVILVLLSVVSACDSTSIGNKDEDPSPPRLLRILAQPQKRTCTRCAITDLLDVAPPAACSADNPCPVNFQVHGKAPTCQIPAGETVGACTDPLRAAPVGIGPPTEGNALRLVFSKPLDPGIGVPRMGDMTNPTMLSTTIVQVEDPAGRPLTATSWYDPSGSRLSADPLAQPFGPAIEIDLKAQLAPATTYTLRFFSTLVRDRLGQPVADLPPTYTLTFTTESDIALMGVTPDVRPALDMAAQKPAILPDDVIQLAFNVPVADPLATGARATAVLKLGDTVVPTEMWLDAGGPGKCAVNKYQLDIVATSAPGVPVPLAAGQYTLTVTNVVDGVAGHSTAFSATYKFFVAGQPDPTHDKSSVANFYVPGPTPCM